MANKVSVTVTSSKTKDTLYTSEAVKLVINSSYLNNKGQDLCVRYGRSNKHTGCKNY